MQGRTWMSPPPEVEDIRWHWVGFAGTNDDDSSASPWEWVPHLRVWIACGDAIEPEKATEAGHYYIEPVRSHNMSKHTQRIVSRYIRRQLKEWGL